jgi:hypothetical protein
MAIVARADILASLRSQITRLESALSRLKSPFSATHDEHVRQNFLDPFDDRHNFSRFEISRREILFSDRLAT